jgi:hypothetical protein
VFQVAEDVAHSEGRLEVNIQLLNRLDEACDQSRTLPWHAKAEAQLEAFLATRSKQASIFIQPSMEAAAEREAKQRDAIIVLPEDVAKIVETQLAGVSWEDEALKRVESAPDFIRAGIKKAAEFSARSEGLKQIDTLSLTRFRNKAMMRAVKRMKCFGMNKLSFDGFAIAQERTPRLQENSQAEQRFAEIQEYVESKQGEDGSGLGLLDRELLDKMKAELEG